MNHIGYHQSSNHFSALSNMCMLRVLASHATLFISPIVKLMSTKLQPPTTSYVQQQDTNLMNHAIKNSFTIFFADYNSKY